MEGLKVKEINASEPILSEVLRLEAEFYTANTFRLNNFSTGDEIIKFVQYGTSEALNENSLGYPILRLNEFESLFISNPKKYCDQINELTFKSLQLKKNDVLICRTNGNPKFVGRAALVTKNYNFAYASYLFKIRPDPKIINSATLVVYLNSKYGRSEIEKFSMASNQVNFSPAKFREVRIPKLGLKINTLIETIVYLSYKFLVRHRMLYEQAKIILLHEIGLQESHLFTDQVNLKSIKSSFGSTGRLDAEYYQKKYEECSKIIMNYKGGFDKLSSVCEVNDSNYTPKPEVVYKYIELSDIGNSGFINSCTTAYGSLLPTRARRLVHAGDVIVSSIEGSLSNCALVSQIYNEALCSTGFYSIKSKIINSETLLVLFKSELIQNILKQHCSGTILTSINRVDFKNIPIPIIDVNIQNKIKNIFSKSFDLKDKSDRLLDLAFLGLEYSIEKNENIAFNFIKNKLKLYA